MKAVGEHGFYDYKLAVSLTKNKNRIKLILYMYPNERVKIRNSHKMKQKRPRGYNLVKYSEGVHWLNFLNARLNVLFEAKPASLAIASKV